MNPEQVLLLLEQIGEMLSPGAQEIWRITTQAVIRLGYINLGWAIASLLGGLGFLKMALHGAALNKECKYEDEGWGCMVAGFIGAAAFAIVFACCITTAALYLSMPEYYAMQKLLVMLRGG